MILPAINVHLFRNFQGSHVYFFLSPAISSLYPNDGWFYAPIILFIGGYISRHKFPLISRNMALSPRCGQISNFSMSFLHFSRIVQGLGSIHLPQPAAFASPPRRRLLQRCHRRLRARSLLAPGGGAAGAAGDHHRCRCRRGGGAEGGDPSVRTGRPGSGEWDLELLKWWKYWAFLWCKMFSWDDIESVDRNGIGR